MKNKKITALYCRVAFADLGKLAEQEKILRQYAGENGYKNCVCFHDNGESGTTLTRRGMNDMLFQIRQGAVSRVIVSDIARIARNVLLVQSFLGLLDDMGVECIVLDTGTLKYGGWPGVAESLTG